MKEETGYTAKRVLTEYTSPAIWNDPWKSSEKTKIVFLEIDGDDEIN